MKYENKLQIRKEIYTNNKPKNYFFFYQEDTKHGWYPHL